MKMDSMYFCCECNLSNYIGDVEAIPLNLGHEYVWINRYLLEDLGVRKEEWRPCVDLVLEEVRSKGVYVLPYGGTQYGEYRDLGDGRGGYVGRLILGNQSLDVSIKGSGPTKYARGNGLVTQSEYDSELLLGESLAYKGVQATRVLASWVDSKTVTPMYLRLTKSLVRVGTIEYLSRLEKGNELVDRLCHYYMECVERRRYVNRVDLLRVVIENYIRTCQEWEEHKFCHGRLNTDNVLLCGYAHDMVRGGVEGGMYSLSNQRYAICWAMEQLGTSLGIQEGVCRELVSQIVN